METQDSTFAVETAEIRFLDLGTEFSVRSIDNDILEVDVLEGEIELQSRNRIPKYFWIFDMLILRSKWVKKQNPWMG